MRRSWHEYTKRCYRYGKKNSIRPAHHQFPVLDAFNRYQLVGQFGKPVCRAGYGGNLQAEAFVQVILRGREDHVLVSLLDIGYPRCDFPPHLVVHNDDRSGHDMIALPLFLGHVFLYQKPDGLGTVGESVVADKAVEGFEQMIFQRYSETL